MKRSHVCINLCGEDDEVAVVTYVKDGVAVVEDLYLVKKEKKDEIINVCWDAEITQVATCKQQTWDDCFVEAHGILDWCRQIM